MHDLSLASQALSLMRRHDRFEVLQWQCALTALVLFVGFIIFSLVAVLQVGQPLFLSVSLALSLGGVSAVFSAIDQTLPPRSKR